MRRGRIIGWLGVAWDGVVAVLLAPVDVIRMTWLFGALTVRYIGQAYLNLLAGSGRGRRASMEFRPCRPRQGKEAWDDQKRFVVGRGLTWRLLGWCSGSPQVRSHRFRADGAGLPGRIELTGRQYGRMGVLLALTWAVAAVGPLAAARVRAARDRGEDRAEAYRRSADRLYVEGAYGRARIQYLNAAQRNPADAEAQWGVARCALRQGRAGEARDALERTLELEGARGEARTILIDLLLAGGDAERALRHALRGVQLDPADAGARTRLGECQRRLGRVSLAREEAEKVLARDPGDVGALLLAATAAADGSDLAAANGHLDRLLRAGPREGVDPLAVARVLRRCRRFAEAKAQLDLALARDPGSVEAMRELGECQLAAGDLDGAVERYQALEEKAPEDEALRIRLAELLLLGQRLDEAHVVGQALDRRWPEGAAGPLVLGSVYYLRGLWTACAEQCRACVRRDPRNIAGRVLLARALMRLGNHEEALSWLKRLPATHRQDLEILMLMAECQVERGERKAAEDLLQQAMLWHPDAESPHLLRARLHLAAGETAEAIGSYEKALGLKPEQPLALNNLASLLASREAGRFQDVARALTLATEAWNLQPDRPEIAETLGWIHVLRGDWVEGEMLLSQAARRLPRDPLVRYHLAHALAGRGRIRDASRQLEMASELSPELSKGPEFQTLRETLLARGEGAAGP